ncbi:MAG TPA: ROK family protein, partial [Actinomycetota bacterium]|nr:ROK family protein [Actinomycetota bacterium]
MTRRPAGAYRPAEPEGFLTIFARLASRTGERGDEPTNHRPRLTAGTPGLLRSINQRSVLELIRERGPLSRAQVARDTGLSKPTVSLALSSLLADGLVREVGRSTGGKGPGAVLYQLDPSAGWVVGIDVGRRWVRSAIADIAGEIVARRSERARARSARSLIGQIGDVAHHLAAEAGIDWHQVTHATIGSPGVFDPRRGLMEMAPNLPGWGRQGIVEAVREHLGTNVTVENDVNLAALGERARGHGRTFEDFVYLSVGTGIGIGIVLGGRLYRGARGAAGEIGYLPVGTGDPATRATRRRGAFEEAAAAEGIVRLAHEAGVPGETAEQVFAAARRGDLRAIRAVEAEARLLALGIAAIAPVLDPEAVILGGGVGRSGDLLVERIERELHALSPFRPRILVSELGEEAVLAGAVATSLDEARHEIFE